MAVSEWEVIVKFNHGDENREAQYPLSYKESFEDIRNALCKYEEEYKGNYDELRFEYKFKPLQYGAISNWYELQGRYTDPAKIVLYGKVKSNG